MKRSVLISICLGAIALSGACSRRDNAQADRTNTQRIARTLSNWQRIPGAISAVTVDGCLTASGGKFMLASLDKDALKTTVYQLMNADDQLRNFVGKEVRVTGQAEATQSAETREVTPSGAGCHERSAD
jgi:hypothetical protein